jgi:3-phosphoshikimate 1-carboxyvinyltransferase
VMRALGADIERGEAEGLVIEGTAMRLQTPADWLDCGNSGTTMRLVMGALAGQGVDAVLVGDASLVRRPMERLAAPLRAMGARITSDHGHAPVHIAPARLCGVSHALAVASAQVKTALLLAGMQADGRTIVREPELSRDHSERMLGAMGVELVRDGLAVSIEGPTVPNAVDVEVPGDPSSAAFFVVAAAMVPGSDVIIEHVCLNPTRVGFIEVLRRMGASIETTETIEDGGGTIGGERVGDVRVRGSRLRATRIDAAEIPATIDELPVLAIAAAAAEGATVVCGASELRVKESDRIAAMARLLGSLGIRVDEHADGMTIHGGRITTGAVDSVGDHRVAMSAAVAALSATGSVEIAGAGVAAVSFPDFYDRLEGLWQ